MSPYCKTLSLFSLFACSLGFPSASFAATKTDSSATAMTQALYNNLNTLMAMNATAFGQQYATWTGINSGGGGTWTSDADRSDIKSVTGFHPAVTGWSFATYLNLSATGKTNFVQRLKDDFNRNTIITIHWPMENLITGGNDNDTTGMNGYPTTSDPTILQRAVTNGDACNTTLNANLDAFATFLGLLNEGGNPIPIIFRPFHEMNGAGHWWGTGSNNDFTEYKALWNYVLSYLKNTKNIHQLLYAYAPAGNKMTAGTIAEYLENWPGDASVDVCGVDLYTKDGDPSTWNAKMETTYQVASTRSMPAAFTELGCKDGLAYTTNNQWWTSRVLADFNKSSNPLWTKCAFMLTWTQQDASSFFVPYPGHSQTADFNNFVNDSHILLQPDLPPMYSSSTTVTFTSTSSRDGWILESGETTNAGGTFDATASTTSALRTGDTGGGNIDRQYKTVVSFDTSSLPDSGITITSVTLRLKRGSLTGTNPFTTHGASRVDMIGGNGFGGALTLAAGDFQYSTGVTTQVATMSDPVSNGNWSTGTLNASGLAVINKTGSTQLRVYFTSDDNDDNGNDYIGWYSGEAAVGNKPELVITYQ